MKKLKLPDIAGKNANWCSHIGKQFLRVKHKIDPEIPKYTSVSTPTQENWKHTLPSEL